MIRLRSNAARGLIAAGFLFPGIAPAQTPGCTVPSVTITHPAGLVANPNPNQLVTLDTNRYPTALCNDGTPAKYGIRFGNQSTRWIFQLQAGGSCNDSTSCLARYTQDAGRQVTSSLGITQSWADQAMWGKGVTDPNMIPGSVSTGILSPSPRLNPDFFDANIVYVFYCTSDNYTGNTTSSLPFDPTDATTWTFQGRAVAMAAVTDVVNSPAFATATDVLYTGTSAGAQGAILTYNDVLPLFPASVRVVGSADGGFANIDYPAFDPSAAAPGYLSARQPTKLQSSIQKQDALWRGRGDLNCALVASGNLRLRCYETSFVLGNGFIQQPFAVFNATADQQHLLRDSVPYCNIYQNCDPSNPASAVQAQADSYVGNFAQSALLPRLGALPSPISAVVPNNVGHVFLTESSFASSILPAGSTKPASIRSLFGSYYRNPCPARLIRDVTPLQR